MSEVYSADLKIQDMTCNAKVDGDKLIVSTTIVIHNDYDDTARHIAVVVVLPPTSRVLCTRSRETDSPTEVGAVIGPAYPPSAGSSWRTQGYVMFLHPDTMEVGDTFTMHLETEMYDAYQDKPIAAFVFGSVPDPNPANNFRSVQIDLQ